MTKAKLKALERVWGAEIENRLPLQSTSVVFQQLAADGMVERYSKKFSGIVADGWCLTHAGRFAYCSAQEESP